MQGLLGLLKGVSLFGLEGLAQELLFGKKDKKKKQVEPQTQLIPTRDSDPDPEPDVITPEVLGGALAPLLPQSTVVPDFAPQNIVPGSGIPGIVAEVARINQNLEAMRNALIESAAIENAYRDQLAQDLEDQRAKRDKERSLSRNEKRKSNLFKRMGSPGAKTAKEWTSLASQGLALELMNALIPSKKDQDQKMLDDQNENIPQGINRHFLGALDYMSGGLTDFDKRGTGNWNLFNPIFGGSDQRWGESGESENGMNDLVNQWWDFLRMFENKPNQNSSSESKANQPVESTIGKETVEKMFPTSEQSEAQKGSDIINNLFGNQSSTNVDQSNTITTNNRSVTVASNGNNRRYAPVESKGNITTQLIDKRVSASSDKKDTTSAPSLGNSFAWKEPRRFPTGYQGIYLSETV